MFNNKRIKFLTILAIMLYTNMTMAKNNISESEAHQTINWLDPIELMEKQLDYFDNYWNKFYNRYYSINNKLIVQDKQYLMFLEIPGYDKEQIKIKLNGNRLVVSGDLKKENRKDATADYLYSEQNNFSFSFILNEDVDKAKITSNLKNGILTIILPRIKIKDLEAKEIIVN